MHIIYIIHKTGPSSIFHPGFHASSRHCNLQKMHSKFLNHTQQSCLEKVLLVAKFEILHLMFCISSPGFWMNLSILSSLYMQSLNTSGGANKGKKE